MPNKTKAIYIARLNIFNYIANISPYQAHKINIFNHITWAKQSDI